MRLCLGTVQFGLDYGIRGQKKPALEDAVSWLDYAVHNGIEAIDTAEAYGNAQEVVGEFLKRKTIDREKLFISTKLKPNILDEVAPDSYYPFIKNRLEQSLKILNTDHVDAYLFHSARYAFRPELLSALKRLREEGLALKTGVSVYEPEEAVTCIESPDVDFIQLPYSIFDHRMKQAGVFEKAKGRGTEIHSRSAFIQGLILMDEAEVPEFLSEARPIVKRIQDFCKDNDINRVGLALAYVKREEEISHLVFGVDSLSQLKEDIGLFEKDYPAGLLKEMETVFDDIKAEIVMPSLWKK